MAGRVLDFSKAVSLPGTLEIGRFCEISTTCAAKPLPSNSGADMELRASEDGLGCVRGTALALAFEAAVGLVIYGVWCLLHLLH